MFSIAIFLVMIGATRNYILYLWSRRWIRVEAKVIEKATEERIVEENTLIMPRIKYEYFFNGRYYENKRIYFEIYSLDPDDEIVRLFDEIEVKGNIYVYVNPLFPSMAVMKRKYGGLNPVIYLILFLIIMVYTGNQ